MAETAQAPKDESVLEEAQNLLVQGKRAMALEDFQTATDMLEQAVQLYDAFYGIGKMECADAYLEYGLALVALANLEAGSGTDRIMKKAGIECDEDEGDEEDEDEEDEEPNDEGENEASPKDKEGDTNGDANGKTEENGKDSEKVTTNGQANGASELLDDKEQPMQTSTSRLDPTPGTSSGHTEGGDDKDSEDAEDEEATTIEVAFEVLCLAKRLFMLDESMEGRLKLAETLQKLGEISIEWDNNDNAVGILEECLNIRQAILQPDDRLIALTYYQLGLAYSFKSDTQNANLNFQNASDVIEKKIESLSQDLEKARANQDTAAVSTCELHINELKEILPDINMRMDDTKADDTITSEALKRTRDEIQKEDEEVKKVCLDNTKSVDDISHLVKRKAT